MGFLKQKMICAENLQQKPTFLYKLTFAKDEYMYCFC